MELADWSDVLQVIGSLGLVVGLVLVAVQINQNSSLMRAELSSNRYDAWLEIDASKRGDKFASVLAKSIRNPADLSLSEMIEMDGYLLNFIAQLDREYYLSGLHTFSSNPDKTVAENVVLYMGNQFAQSWWIEQRSDKLWSPLLIDVIDEVLQTVSATRDSEYYENIKSRLIPAATGLR